MFEYLTFHNNIRMPPEKNTEDQEYEKLKRMLKSIKKRGLKAGLSEDEILAMVRSKLLKEQTDKDSNWLQYFENFSIMPFLCIAVVLTAILLNTRKITSNRCLIENNYFVMEMTRPITDCDICRDITEFQILENVTKDEFVNYAYAGQPLLVKGGCLNWTALDAFSFDFFKDLYDNTEGAYDAVEEQCQFFPFRTTFLSLNEVLHMPESRAKMLSKDEETWYIGWSNCNPDIASVIRKHYTRPYFLPDDSELSAIDWIFMGYKGQGASMHLDYVRRPSWQAQIRGKKSWYLVPPPECESVCSPMNITVQRGDIVMIDTNQWYHTTQAEGDEMSLTLGSEYD